VSGFAPDLPNFHARRIPDAIALANADTGQTYSWARLDERVGRVATVLTEHYGVVAGRRVCLVSENDPRVFELQFACMRLGALFVPLNWRLALPELRSLVQEAEPAVMVHDGSWRGLAIELAATVGVDLVSWDDPAAGAGHDYETLLASATWLPPQPHTFDEPTHILYTSGTTGMPKGALSTHGTIFWQAANLSLASRLGRPSHMLCPIPLFHAGGLLTLAMPLLHYGGRVTTMRRFQPAAILPILIDPAAPVTHLSQIPAMYQAIAQVPGFQSADLSQMRCGVVAGAVVQPELVQTWWDRGARLQPQFGGTEMGPCALVLDTDDLEHGKRGSQGMPPIHTELRLVDADGDAIEGVGEGEMWLRGPSVTTGYWRRDKADYFAPGGWLRTGDVARRDEDGYYYFTGRTKEMYKSGGENVFLAEVERVLVDHPSVGDIAIIDVPDEEWGEMGMAVVVTKPGTTLTLESLRDFGSLQLARYKLPKRLVLVEELARNVTGKVSRAELRRRYGGMPR
jgi:fatty-acyl-CoA synthase